MELLTPLGTAELDAAIAELQVQWSEATVTSRAGRRDQLRALHQVLMRATALRDDPPRSSLRATRELLDAADSELVDAMSPRPRTVFRLLRAGALDAAWQVLIDNATGVVAEPFHASTATGSARTAWRLPLLTSVEAPTVFADLPGFRDPRYAAADDCYDITALIRLRHQLDEVSVAAAGVTLSGWCALDLLSTGPDEDVAVIASNGELEVPAVGHRVRRPDLATGGVHERERRVWAGWAATLDGADPRLVSGSWALWLQLDHAGIVHRAPIGGAVGELARAATGPDVDVGSRTIRWNTGDRQWRLLVTDP